MRIRLHPSFRELNRLADRELDEDRQRELHAHLLECQGCRDQVALMRDMGRAAREISHPSPPEDSLSRILERRAAGDRVILPVTSALRSSRQRKAIGIAAGIGGALLAATLLLLPANEASAGASDLRFDPAQPEPGDSIEVRYVPTSALAAEQTLYLRGAFRRPGDVAPRRGLPGAIRVELHRNSDGTYSGVVLMPPDAVFGYFAVENEAASELDLKDERFWPILAHEDGVPTREALRAQLAVIRPADVEFGLIAADMLLQYYPDDPVGWDRKLTFEQRTVVGEERRLLLAEHSSNLVELSRARELSGTRDFEELESLWRYARQLEDTDLTERWASELLRDGDHAARTTAARIRIEVELQDKDSERRLEVYEREWVLAGLSYDFIVGRAFRLAAEGQDPEVVLRWARRHNRVRPEEIHVVASALNSFPSLGEPVRDGVRAELRRLDTPSAERRNLNETADQLQARERQRVSLLLGTLGRLLFEEGRYEAATDTLERAVEAAWNLDAFRSLAESYSAMGDVSEALTLYAVVMAGERDPDARRDLLSSLQRRFGPLFPDEAKWSRWISEARQEIDERLLTDAGRPTRLAGNPMVETRDGESRSLGSLVAGNVAIVVFWSGSPSKEAAGLRTGQSELQTLKDRDIAVITITETPQSTDLDDLLREEGIELDVYYDHEWEAHRSLKCDGLPYFFVVDQQGGFLFAEDLEQAIRLAESLERRGESAA